MLKYQNWSRVQPNSCSPAPLENREGWDHGITVLYVAPSSKLDGKGRRERPDKPSQRPTSPNALGSTPGSAETETQEGGCGRGRQFALASPSLLQLRTLGCRAMGPIIDVLAIFKGISTQ